MSRERLTRRLALVLAGVMIMGGLLPTAAFANHSVSVTRTSPATSPGKGTTVSWSWTTAKTASVTCQLTKDGAPATGVLLYDTCGLATETGSSKSASVTHLLASGDGSYAFTVTATTGTNVNNFETVTGSASYVLDTQSPETAITSGPSGTITTNSATFNFESSEASSTFQCKLDAGSYAACNANNVSASGKTTGSVTYTGLSEGPHTFSVQASDAATNVDGTPATATFTVNAVNEAPACSNDSGTTAEDSDLNDSVICSDVDGDTLTYSKVSDPTNGLLTFNSDGSFTYTPNANYNGSDSFTFKANDGKVDSNTATYSISVTQVDDAPACSNDSGSTPEDTALNDSVSCTDSDSQNLTYSKVASPTNGSLTFNSDGSFTYTPNANYNGSDSFTFKANDGNSDSNVATYSITVSPVNDAPACSNDSGSTEEDTSLNDSVTCTDLDGDTLTYSKVSDPTNGSLTFNSDGSFTYTPNANYNGPDSFTFKANDGKVDSNVATYSISVSGTNDAPIATDDSGSTDEDASTTINVTANDSDVDGDTLTASGSGDTAEGGTFSCGTPSTSCTYNPSANFSGSDSFDYTVSDGTTTDTGTVQVTVAPVDEPGGTDPDPAPTPDPTPTPDAPPAPDAPGPGPVGDTTAPQGDADANSDVISPNGDGRLDALNVDGSFNEVADWTFSVSSSAAPTFFAADAPLFNVSGEGTSFDVTWDGSSSDGSPVADGKYLWRVEARDAAGNAMAPITGQVEVDRTAPVFTDLKVFPKRFDRSEDDYMAIEFGVSEASRVKAKIVKKGRTIKKLGTLHFTRAGNSQFGWNAKNRSGNRVKAGRYRVVIKAVDEAFNRTTNRALVVRVVR